LARADDEPPSRATIDSVFTTAVFAPPFNVSVTSTRTLRSDAGFDDGTMPIVTGSGGISLVSGGGFTGGVAGACWARPIDGDATMARAARAARMGNIRVLLERRIRRAHR
jgi:hypothetical protein